MNRLPAHPPRPAQARIRVVRDDEAARRRRLAMRIGVLTAAALAAMTLGGKPARAVDQSVEFGAPTVLSQQGQRLKVLVPVRSAPGDRATAAAFLVRETEVPQGHQPPAAAEFTVMRPAQSDYVVLQSAEIIRSPQVALLLSVAGDPRSPYRMDLEIPRQTDTTARLASARQAGTRSDADGRNGAARGASALQTRRLRGPTGDPTLPPK